jgi:predicted RNA binding protein YcfA (HicA-like mRNA interferase family)
MGTLAGLSGKEVIRRLKKLGYIIARQRGSHVRLHHPAKPSLTVPLHREIKIGLMMQLIHDAGSDQKTFENL